MLLLIIICHLQGISLFLPLRPWDSWQRSCSPFWLYHCPPSFHFFNNITKQSLFSFSKWTLCLDLEDLQHVECSELVTLLARVLFSFLLKYSPRTEEQSGCLVHLWYQHHKHEQTQHTAACFQVRMWTYQLCKYLCRCTLVVRAGAREGKLPKVVSLLEKRVCVLNFYLHTGQ